MRRLSLAFRPMRLTRPLGTVVRLSASTSPSPPTGTRRCPSPALSTSPPIHLSGPSPVPPLSSPGAPEGEGVLNPRELAARLDRYVVGQDKAKKVLAVAVYNHYARLRHLAASRPCPPAPVEAFEPDAPIASDAFTPSYSSPPPGLLPRRRRSQPSSSDFDPTTYDSASTPVPVPAPRRTRKPTLARPSEPQEEPVVHEKSNVLLLGPTGSGKSLLARTLARTLDVPFVGVEATGMTMAGYVGEDVESCVHRLLVAADYDPIRASSGIIFIDEIDKLARSPLSLAKDVAGEGVQQALLKILEGTLVSVPEREGRAGRGPKKDGAVIVDTTNVLFILSGAFVGLEDQIARRSSRSSTIGFHARSFFTPSTLSQPTPSDLVSFGFIPEFIGRLPVLATLLPLSPADLLRVLTEPRNALVRQYEVLFRASGVEIRFTTPSLREVARMAGERGTGARGLRGILEEVLLEPMFIAPASSIQYVLIDREVVRDGKETRCYSRGQQSVFESDFEAEESEGERESEAEVVEKRRATA